MLADRQIDGQTDRQTDRQMTNTHRETLQTCSSKYFAVLPAQKSHAVCNTMLELVTWPLATATQPVMCSLANW